MNKAIFLFLGCAASCATVPSAGSQEMDGVQQSASLYVGEASLNSDWDEGVDLSDHDTLGIEYARVQPSSWGFGRGGANSFGDL